MNKQEFFAGLRNALSGLPREDVEERVTFYGEMIDDRIEEGMSEEDAVAGIGPIDEIREQVIADTPIRKLIKEKVKPNRALRVWEIALIILGFPLWFPLIAAAAAVILALYIVLWSLVISLWAIVVSFWAGSLAGLAAGAVCFVRGDNAAALVLIGSALIIAGLSIFLFFGCAAASKGMFRLTKKAGLGIKSRFVRKEDGQ